MGIRRCSIVLGALALAVAGGVVAPAHAGSPTDLVFQPFAATGAILNPAPPSKIANTVRLELDGDNFTMHQLTSHTASVDKRIDSRGALGVYVVPVVTAFTRNGAPSDFAHAIVIGCTLSVSGIVIQLPTQVGQDQPYALQVDSTCP